MEHQTVARVLALGRAAVGVALVAVPARAGSGWVGEASRRPGTQVALASVGARDLALGLGTAWAVGGKDGARPWLLAAAGCDVVDLLATLRHRDLVSPNAVIAVSAVIGGSAAAGLWLAGQLD